ncbi:MAG: GDP-L-fucose synthase [Myxococcota bacterium]|nr:GDP-L-fucose synthase [Myxococcota bacterium]
MAKFFVTGASGYVGQALVRRLVADKHEVMGLARSSEAAAAVRRAGAREIRGDLANREALKTGVEQAEFVVHAAGGPGKSPEEALRLNAEGTSNLIAACEGLPLKGVLFVSTIAVFACRQGETVTEATPTCPDTGYGRAKVVAEQLMLAFGRETGTPVWIVRPGAVYGPRAPIFKRHIVPEKNQVLVYGQGDNLINPIHIDDLVEAMVLVMQGAKPQSVFNVTDMTPPKNRVFWQAVADAIQADLVTVENPDDSWGFYAAIKSKLAPQGPFAGEVARIVSTNMHVKYNAIRDLGLKHKYETYRDGLPAAFKDWNPKRPG